MAQRTMRASDGRVRVVSLHGEFDFGTTAVLRAALETVACDARPLTVIDLSDVAFMDCATVRVLKMEARRLARRGGRLALASPHGRVEWMLDWTDMTNDCSVCATVTGAVTVVSQDLCRRPPSTRMASPVGDRVSSFLSHLPAGVAKRVSESP